MQYKAPSGAFYSILKKALGIKRKSLFDNILNQLKIQIIILNLRIFIMKKEQARQIPLDEYLSSLGHEPINRRWAQLLYHSPLRGAGNTDSKPSFSVNVEKGVFNDFGTDDKGTIFDLTSAYFNIDRQNFAEILAKIAEVVNFNVNQIMTRPQTAERPEKSEYKLKCLSKGPIQRPEIINYLASKSLDLAVVEKFPEHFCEVFYGVPSKFQAGKLVRYAALGFLNDSGGYDLSITGFKSCLGPKDISTIELNPESRYDGEAVFESWSDFCAFVSDRPQALGILRRVTVLNSVQLAAKAVETIGGRSPLNVFLFLDNDKAGDTATAKLLKWLSGDVKDRRDLYMGFKDYNDFRLAYKTERQETE